MEKSINMEPQIEKPQALLKISEDQIVNLDVRPILQSGGEPFSEIMNAIGKTSDDGALKLRATFKPVPLFRVLGNQGWQYWVEYGDGDDWMIWFYKSQDANATAKDISKAELKAAHLQKDNPELKERLTAQGQKWTLNVKGMSPPEPIELTLSVLDQLPKDTQLVQVNERVPQFLLPILEERGFKYNITQHPHEEVKIEISYK